MKFRLSQWLDTSNKDAEEWPIMYGIQANKCDGKGWANVAEDGEPLLFNTPEAAGEKLKELRARYAA